jgi:hypothetical protein
MRQLILVSVLLSGCLSNAYRVRSDEVWRLSQTPPAERPTRVRVSQLTGWDTIPEAPPAPSLAVVPAPSLYWGGRTTYNPPSGGSSSGGSSSGGSSSGGSGSGRGSGSSALAAGVAIVALAASAFFVVAATDASRFDGYAQLDPNAQIILHRGGSWISMPLSLLSPNDAYITDDALVLHEGAFYELDRAPLTRVGLAFGIDGGAAAVTGTRAGDQPWWPTARLRLGLFPVEWLGIYADLGFVFAGDRGALVNMRFGGEAQLIPFNVGIVHFGLYGRAGDNFVAHENVGDYHGFHGGGGLLVELEVTTHMTFVLHGGVSAIYERGGYVPIGEVTVGATAY